VAAKEKEEEEDAWTKKFPPSSAAASLRLAKIYGLMAGEKVTRRRSAMRTPIPATAKNVAL